MRVHSKYVTDLFQTLLKSLLTLSHQTWLQRQDKTSLQRHNCLASPLTLMSKWKSGIVPWLVWQHQCQTLCGVPTSQCVFVCVYYVYIPAFVWLPVSALLSVPSLPVSLSFLSFSKLQELWSLHSLSLANDCRGWQSTVSMHRHSQ